MSEARLTALGIIRAIAHQDGVALRALAAVADEDPHRVIVELASFAAVHAAASAAAEDMSLDDALDALTAAAVRNELW